MDTKFIIVYCSLLKIYDSAPNSWLNCGVGDSQNSVIAKIWFFKQNNITEQKARWANHKFAIIEKSSHDSTICFSKSVIISIKTYNTQHDDTINRFISAIK